MTEGDQMKSACGILGIVTVEIHDQDGNLTFREVTHNLVTAVGDQLYASRGVGLSTSALPIGMKLGTGSTAPAKSGAGAALVAYLTDSHQAFDASFPTVVGGVVTYKVTYPPGKATSASTPITEVVIYTDATANSTSSAANTIARALVSGNPSKQAADTMTVTWAHVVLGA